jgi:cell filamentation protein, protein adenylyltransferase
MRNSPVGKLVPRKEADAQGRRREYEAFVPDSLPRELELETSTWNVVVEAATALSKLDQGGSQIPAPELLRGPAIRREAQSTSALEGTYAAFTDLLEAEQQDERPQRGAIVELLNYVRVAEHAFDWVAERPVTLTVLGQLQKTLVANTPGDLPDAGGVRDRQVFVGSPGGTMEDARYIPPPPGDPLKGSMEELLSWMGDEGSKLPPVVRAALAHYQFEALHPFSDGNGRIGRLLIVLQLMQDRVLRDPLLVVSPWFEARRREYQDRLLSLSQTGDFDAWVSFFCEGIRSQALSTLERVERLLSYQQEVRELCQGTRVRGVAARIAEDLIGNPMLQPTRTGRRYDVSYQAANKAIARLVELGLLEEMTGRRYGRTYRAPGVLAILD